MTPIHERIIALYGPHILRRSALSIRGGGGVIERVMAGKGIRTALEIGTYRGVSAAEMSQFCERVVTIDLRHGRMEQLGDTHDRATFWRSLGIDNIELRLVADDAEKRRVIEALDFDFAFVDGAHDARVADDFAMVRKCGRVLFHDADDNRKRAIKPDASNSVFEFLETLPQEDLAFDDIFCLWTAPK